MWGKWDNRDRRIPTLWPIPTYVGKTQPTDNLSVTEADNPHPCGENDGGRGLFSYPQDPSPPVWGKPLPPSPTTSCTPTHPHPCGENDWSKVVFRVPYDPSPPVWGKLNGQLADPIEETTHPHPCGENGPYGVNSHNDHDPSPPVWGKPFPDGRLNNTRTGQSPLNVGNIQHDIPRAPLSLVDPRFTGEAMRKNPYTLRSCGSIPACVGKTFSRGAPLKNSPANPRLRGKDLDKSPLRIDLRWSIPAYRGENGQRGAPPTVYCGSSPLSWGKRDV